MLQGLQRKEFPSSLSSFQHEVNLYKKERRKEEEEISLVRKVAFSNHNKQ